MQTRTITRTPPDREPRPASWFATASFAIAFFVLTLRWGSAPAGNEVDPSWTAVMAWAFRHGARWGTDVVFTHGPLGFLHPLASYDPSTHGVFLTAQLAIAALGSVVAALVFRTLDRIGQAWLFASIVVFHASLWADTLWIALLAMSMVALARSIATKATDGTVLALAVSTIVYGAIVAMIKVSLLPLVVLWAVAAPLMCAIDRRPRTALVVTVLFPSVFVALWIAAAQPLAMLPAHLGWSLHIAAAYGHAMGAGASIPVDLLGLAVFGSTAIVLVRLLADARRDGVRAIALLYTGAAQGLIGVGLAQALLPRG
jgi:hypothetical protein